MKKIAIATATRAEYGILHPLLVRLVEEKEFDVQLHTWKNSLGIR